MKSWPFSAMSASRVEARSDCYVLCVYQIKDYQLQRLRLGSFDKNRAASLLRAALSKELRTAVEGLRPGVFGMLNTTGQPVHKTERPRRILVIGCLFGAVLGLRLAHAGHAITFVGKPEEIARGARHGVCLDIPLKGTDQRTCISSGILQPKPAFLNADNVDAGQFDLCILAVNESLFSDPALHHLVRRLGGARVPCLSLMNVLLPPYLSQISDELATAAQAAYRNSSLWRHLPADIFVATSPDPQAVRPDPADPSLVSVSLGSNIKYAPPKDQAIGRLLAQLSDDLDRAQVSLNGEVFAPRVRLVKAKSSHSVLTKWPMLVTGNLRCVLPCSIRSISEAVHDDLAEARHIYEWVSDLCADLGTPRSELVPFERYAAAAASLTAPSSMARNIQGGSTAVERFDVLVQCIGNTFGRQFGALNDWVDLVSMRLQANQSQQGGGQEACPEAVLT